MQRMIAVALRGITLLSKFLLILFLAKQLSPADVGLYGLMTATLVIVMQVVGLDFYAFNTREVIQKESHEQVVLIRDQMAFHGVCYLFLFPLFSFIFLLHVLPQELIFWFYGLLLTEHLAQEADRLLVNLKKVIAANVVMFLRYGVWAYVIVAFALLNRAFTLSDVWLYWLLGDVAALILVVLSVKNMPWHACRKIPIDWGWIKKGCRNAIIFFASTISLQVMTYANRYFIKYMLGLKPLGVFVFYSSTLNVILTFAQVGIYSFVIPPMIAAYHKDKTTLRPGINKLFLEIGGYLILASVAAFFGINILLKLVHKEIYMNQLSIFNVLLFATILNVFSQVSHYGLYIIYKEKLLLWVSVASLVATLGFNFILIDAYGLMGAAWAAVATMAFTFVAKQYLYSRIAR